MTPSTIWSELRLVGASDAIADIDADIQLAARSSGGVLITGEAGSGKELIARLIHQRTYGDGAPFVTVDCEKAGDGTFETELFGTREQGPERAGPSHLAAGGTVFLQGIDAVSPRIQDRLCTWLKSMERKRAGEGVSERPTVGRLVAAANPGLYTRVLAGQFRDDLYYRLNVIHLCVPPLRDRVRDVALLVDHFLDSHAAKHGGGPLHLTITAMDTLAAYSWPGNVGELKRAIEHGARTAKGPTVQLSDLPVGVLETPALEWAALCERW